MTMIQRFIGVDPITKQPRFEYVHPFLAGVQRRETRIPDKHVTKKTHREIPAWRVLDRGAFKPVQKEKYNRVKHS